MLSVKKIPKLFTILSSFEYLLQKLFFQSNFSILADAWGFSLSRNKISYTGSKVPSLKTVLASSSWGFDKPVKGLEGALFGFD